MVGSPFSEMIGVMFAISVGVSGVVLSDILCSELDTYITASMCEGLTIGLVIVLPLTVLGLVFLHSS